MQAKKKTREVKHISVYELSVKNRKGEDFALSRLQGKVLLIVNTATGCGFTPFLVDHNGKVLRRLSPIADPMELEERIQALL